MSADFTGDLDVVANQKVQLNFVSSELSFCKSSEDAGNTLSD